VLRPFIPGWDPTTVRVERDGREQRIEVRGANHFLHQVEHFARLVRDPLVDAYPAENGLGNAVVCEAILRSHRTGRVVRI
jgi:predicted dehydrogenase